MEKQFGTARDMMQTCMTAEAGFVAFEWDGGDAGGFCQSSLYDAALSLAQRELGCCVLPERKAGHLVFYPARLTNADFLGTLSIKLSGSE